MRRSTLLLVSLALTLLVPAALPLQAQEEEETNYFKEYPLDDRSAIPAGGGEKQAIGPTFIGSNPAFDPKVVWRQQWICRAFGPGEMTRYRVRCTAASFLDFHTTDAFLPGDHWQLKGKAYDFRPNAAVTTAPGASLNWGVGGRVYNYGGVNPWSPRVLDALVECTYLHGVSVFPGDGLVYFSSDGNCAVTPDPARQEIDRAP